jgi:hypothetical protein
MYEQPRRFESHNEVIVLKYDLDAFVEALVVTMLLFLPPFRWLSSHADTFFAGPTSGRCRAEVKNLVCHVVFSCRSACACGGRKRHNVRKAAILGVSHRIENRSS